MLGGQADAWVGDGWPEVAEGLQCHACTCGHQVLCWKKAGSPWQAQHLEHAVHEQQGAATSQSVLPPLLTWHAR